MAREEDAIGRAGRARRGRLEPPPGRPKAAKAPSGGSEPHEVGERGG